MVGFHELNNLYPKDHKFTEAWKACKELVTLDRTIWLDYMVKNGIVFKESQLCIPRSSMRETLIKEKHSGGMTRHFGQDKTISIIREY